MNITSALVWNGTYFGEYKPYMPFYDFEIVELFIMIIITILIGISIYKKHIHYFIVGASLFVGDVIALKINHIIYLIFNIYGNIYAFLYFFDYIIFYFISIYVMLKIMKLMEVIE